MTAQEFESLCMELVKEVRNRAPRDTGNLEDNGIRYEIISDDTFIIYVDESIAPYMPYTNEAWINPRWKGKKNPNEAWWQDAVNICKNYIISKYSGEEE